MVDWQHAEQGSPVQSEIRLKGWVVEYWKESLLAFRLADSPVAL